MEMPVAVTGVVNGAPPATVEMEYCWASARGARDAAASNARPAKCAAGFNMYESNRVRKE